MHLHPRITLPQHPYQPRQRSFLRRRAGVGRRLAIGGKTSYVAHPYGMGVMTQAMRALPALGTSGLHTSVEPHHIMIAYPVEASRPMPAVYVGSTEVPARSCSGTMHYNLFNLSHILFNCGFYICNLSRQERRQK